MLDMYSKKPLGSLCELFLVAIDDATVSRLVIGVLPLASDPSPGLCPTATKPTIFARGDARSPAGDSSGHATILAAASTQVLQQAPHLVQQQLHQQVPAGLTIWTPLLVLPITIDKEPIVAAGKFQYIFLDRSLKLVDRRLHG
jgi:hypothetical protein